MTETANIELARRLIAAFEAGDDSVVAELIHPAHRSHAREDVGRGVDGVRDSIRWVRARFSERRIAAQDIVASGDRVVARLRVSAIQTGDLPGIAAAGRRVETDQIHIWRVAQGRIAEHWMVRDDLTALRQLDPGTPRP